MIPATPVTNLMMPTNNLRASTTSPTTSAIQSLTITLHPIQSHPFWHSNKNVGDLPTWQWRRRWCYCGKFTPLRHIFPHMVLSPSYVDRAADALNTNCDFTIQADCKSVQKSFNPNYCVYAAMSKVGEEMTDADKLLGKMRKAREEQVMQKNQCKQKIGERGKKGDSCRCYDIPDGTNYWSYHDD